MSTSLMGKARLGSVAVGLFATALGGCFDDPYRSNVGAIDSIDAGTPGQRRIGNLLVFETHFLDDDDAGDGTFVVIGPFQIKDEQIDPSYEEAEGSPFACKVYEKTGAEWKDPGVDIGTLDFSINDGPVIPACKQEGGEWRCTGVAGTGGDIAVVDAVEHIMSLSNPDAAFVAEDLGRMLHVDGASNAVNDGQFAITQVTDEHTIQFYNPRDSAVAETGTPATWRTEYGEGPARQPERIQNDQFLTVRLTAGDAGNFEDFSKTLEFGDSFTPDTASQELIKNIPMDGSEFTVSCDGDGGDCADADATALVIETTDAPLDPAFPSNFPDPVDKHVLIFCLLLVGHVTVPAEASEYLANSGATRVRTIFERAIAETEIQKYAEITIVAGHALMGFTDPPPPE